jgi:hypothetical protein
MDELLAENNSRSEVLRATHLVVVTVKNFKLGEWVPVPDSPLVSRSAEMRLVLDQVLKGNTKQLCGESTSVRVQQVGTGSRRVSDDYGVWSKVVLEPGMRLVAFCAGTSEDLAELLRPPECTRLANTDVLPDLRACMQLESRKLAPAELVTRTASLLTWRSGVLARYVWARSGPTSLEDVSLFELLMQILEHPNTASETREVFMTAAYEDLSLIETPPRAQLLRLARALLVLLAVPQAQELHANLAQVYLPNLIGLRRDHAVMAASDIFTQGSQTHARIMAMLDSRPELDQEGHLRRWLLEGRAGASIP